MRPAAALSWHRYPLGCSKAASWRAFSCLLWSILAWAASVDGAPTGVVWKALRLPRLPPSQASSPESARHWRRGWRWGWRQARQAGKGSRNTPVGAPSTQAAQARTDYNKQLKALQQAALPHPNGYRCQDCAAAGRTAHHPPYECAYNECHNCKRGGHRQRKCTFPKFP